MVWLGLCEVDKTDRQPEHIEATMERRNRTTASERAAASIGRRFSGVGARPAP